MERRLSLLAFRLGDGAEPVRFSSHKEAFEWLFRQPYPLPKGTLMERFVLIRHKKSAGTRYAFNRVSDLENYVLGDYTFMDIVGTAQEAKRIQLNDTQTTESVLDDYVMRILVMSLRSDDKVL